MGNSLVPVPTLTSITGLASVVKVNTITVGNNTAFKPWNLMAIVPSF